MTTNEITLAGCSPTPLASYLKALGVLRLIASPTSSVSGAAADPEVRGWWKNECFYLRTSLDSEALTRFFLEEYAPSPITAPWNGGSGFYPGDNKEGIAPLAGSKVASRFLTIADAIKAAFQEIQKQGWKKRPEGKDKARFVAGLRGCLADEVLDWLDAALALSGDRLNFPQLLGTGGNDGRLDFTNNFMQRLASTFDIATGKPKENAARLLRTALFADGTWGFHKVAIGQFAPGAAGGPNASTGYEADSNVNPWDFVLALEGAIMFAGAATRRHQGSPELGASFPFTVRPTGAGWGGVSDSDEENARAEFWAPLWDQPAGQRELEAFLKEGRAILNGKTARDGLDFARAAASLGTSRGVSAFARYGFVMRSGKAYLAAPLGTLSVGSRPSKAAELISDLDTGDWLRRVRRLAREKGAPARAQTAVKQLEHALFAMSEAHVSPRSVQGALCALGDLVRWLKDSRDVLEKISPPPRLSSKWVRMADDETPEYRVATALASLGWSSGERLRTDTSEDTGTPKKRIALAAHFAPLSAETIPKRRRKWDAQNQTRVVWGAGDLESNLIAVLQRRLIDVTIDAPLEAAAPARLADIAAFVEGNFDDVRCARLLAGLVWAQPARFAEQVRRPVVPFAYAAIKPIFAPAVSLEALAKKRLVPPDCELPIPPGLIARLRSGDVEEAVRLALARAHASGIACPFDRWRKQARGRIRGQSAHASGIACPFPFDPPIIPQTITGRRLAAALLIPLDQYGLQTLMERVYLVKKENEDVD